MYQLPIQRLEYELYSCAVDCRVDRDTLLQAIDCLYELCDSSNCCADSLVMYSQTAQNHIEHYYTR